MTTHMTQPSLPPELEREIFETTAIRDPDCIPTLLLVCRRAKIWIQPLLYRVLSLSSPESEGGSTFSAFDSQSPSFLRNAVRHISLFEVSIRSCEDLLKKCTGTIDLSLDTELEFEFLISLNMTRLQRLAITAPSSASPINWSWASSLTHLDVFQGSGFAGLTSWDKWRGIASLPSLTHLAVSPVLAELVLPRAIEELAHLRLLVVTNYPWGRDEGISFAEQKITIRDVRIVVIVLATRYEEDWKKGAWGGDDFWVRAERFVARKRAGEVEASCYLIDETVEENSSPPALEEARSPS
ncbi:hypothetical protein R3P38DRAFT_3292939 [Favolaschia claudopus]|uniref:F-box domain-containing protein n=1 Tax=Favolaschia claudopus TaxID=2862362 RepID=A0AAV9ZI52_9AGAR